MCDLKIALVIGEKGSDLYQVIDIVGINPVDAQDPDIYCIKTAPFDNHLIKNGAGENVLEYFPSK